MKLNTVIASALVAFSVGCGPAYSGVEVSDKKPTLLINGPIAQGNILPLGEQMIQLANKGEKEVQLIINSPGGQVTTGFLFLSMMEAAKAKGLKVSCFVPTIAASMAFQILMHCDKRYALNTSFLLWHRARVNIGGGMFSSGTPMQGPELVRLGRDLLSVDKVIFDKVSETLGRDVSDKTLMYHFQAETLHMGINLHRLAPHFITTYSSIPGLFDSLFNKKLPQNASIDSADFNYTDIIYMTTKALN